MNNKHETMSNIDGQSLFSPSTDTLFSAFQMYILSGVSPELLSCIHIPEMPYCTETLYCCFLEISKEESDAFLSAPFSLSNHIHNTKITEILNKQNHLFIATNFASASLNYSFNLRKSYTICLNGH